MSPSSPKDKVVMVVDDDKAVLFLFETHLSAAGFQVVLAANGLDAASQIEKKAPDLIVVDLMMPGRSGYELLLLLPSLGARYAPIFVITGSSLDVSTVDMIKREARVQEFFTKPVDMPSFLAKVHHSLKTEPTGRPPERGIADRS
ncbi:MAG: response regulator [Elusimicrobiota bacterium]